MIEKWCDLNGPAMRFRAAEEALLTPAWEGWALTETGRRERPDFTFDIDYGPFREAPAHAPLLFDGIVPPALHCVVRRIGADEHYAIDGRASMLLGERKARLTVCPGEESLVRSSAAFQAIDAALALDGQFVLHAAALAQPDDRSAVLVFGPSGFGKTTTSASLMAAGWRLLTDDVSIVARAGGEDRVWGLPLALKIHRKTADMLPWLAPLLTELWNRSDEQSLSLQALQRLLGRAPGHRTAYPIAAIVVLAERSREGHRLGPIAKSAAFRAILSDNVSRSLEGIGTRQQERVQRITELLRGTPTYELSAGADLPSLSEVLLRGLPHSR